MLPHRRSNIDKQHALFYLWNSMFGRAYYESNPSYPWYGAKGIGVCRRWFNFKLFVADVGRRPSSSHTIDRLNNERDYKPSNVRWATWNQQAKNKG